MKIIDIGSPTPHKNEISYTEYNYPITKKHYLRKPDELDLIDIFEVLHRRTSRRKFNPLDLNILSDLLWHCAHTKSYKRSERKIVWQHRTVPSAGGRHPIDLIIFRPSSIGWELFVYDAFAHCLCELGVSLSLIEEFLLEVDSILSIQQSTVIWFAAQPKRTLSKYTQGDSLVWRDAGVLLGFITIVAEALNLSCCPVGITGNKELSDLLKSNGKLVGVGGCLLGGK